MITITGAGLVGSLWALLLRKKGYPVQVFEKRADPRKQNAGAGRSINLVITSRGLYGLDKAGLLDELKNLAVPVYGRMIHGLKGDLTYQAYGQINECNLSISRDALNQFLISQAQAAGAEFHFEHELQTLNPENRELNFMTPKDPVNVHYDVLFGTDGAGSRVRKELARLYPQDFKESTQWLEADYKELTLPLGKNGRPQLDPKALHIWPRGDQMMMALANRDGSFTMTLYLPKEAFKDLGTSDGIKNLFQTQFADAVPLMPDFVQDFQSHPQGALGTVRTSRWVYGDSIALMGDAAHAIVPFFGQGMNAGFEDCTTLLNLVENNTSWPDILNNFEKRQKRNADAIAEMALENWVEMKSKVADADFLFRKKVEGLLEQRFPQIYKSRYGMITYTLIPYALAKEAGILQSQLIDELVQGISDTAQIPWEKAQTLLENNLKPFLQKHSLSVQKYDPLAGKH